MKKLNPAQINFCHEYVLTSNATKSYMTAYPTASYETANATGCKLLQNPDIIEYIDFLNKEIMKEKIANIDEVLAYVTSVIRDDKEDTDKRLKAADMRLKSLAAYTENRNINTDDFHIEVKINDNE